jgi:hypothetical protein
MEFILPINYNYRQFSANDFNAKKTNENEEATR